MRKEDEHTGARSSRLVLLPAVVVIRVVCSTGGAGVTIVWIFVRTVAVPGPTVVPSIVWIRPIIVTIRWIPIVVTVRRSEQVVRYVTVIIASENYI